MLAPGTDSRVDFERGMRTAPPLILLLIAANVALFGWELAAGALASRESIVEAGALVRDRVLAGEWWRLESATFLHAGWDHLLGNCLVLYVVGMACEHAFGFVRTAIVYFTSGLAGSLLSGALSPGPSVGASGASKSGSRRASCAICSSGSFASTSPIRTPSRIPKKFGARSPFSTSSSGCSASRSTPIASTVRGRSPKP